MSIENKNTGGERLVREQVLNEKVELVSEIKEKFEGAASAVVVEYRGLTVEAITELRRQLHAEGVDFKVYKNTMSRRAASDAGYEDLLDALTGPNAIAFSEDAVAPSRILSKFAKKNKKLIIKKGLVEGKVVAEDKLKELAELPNKEGMLAMLLGALQSPLRDFAWAVKQISEKNSDGSVVETDTTEEAKEEVEAVEVATPVEEAVADEVVEESIEETVEEVAAVEETVEAEKAVEAAEVVQELNEEAETEVADENELEEELVENKEENE